jgi:hypothetical protein
MNGRHSGRFFNSPEEGSIQNQELKTNQFDDLRTHSYESWGLGNMNI